MLTDFAIWHESAVHLSMHWFDKTSHWVIITAVANVVLAGVALWAIRSSNRVARATEKQLRASISPWLTIGTEATPDWEDEGQVCIKDWDGDRTQPDGVYVIVRVRNVGSGLAILRPAKSLLWSWNGTTWSKSVSGGAPNPVLPTERETTIYFTVDRQSHPGTTRKTFTNQMQSTMEGTDGRFRADVVYGDSMAELLTRAEFHFSYVKGSGWVTDSIQYFSPPDSKNPIVAKMR